MQDSLNWDRNWIERARVCQYARRLSLSSAPVLSSQYGYGASAAKTYIYVDKLFECGHDCLLGWIILSRTPELHDNVEEPFKMRFNL